MLAQQYGLNKWIIYPCLDNIYCMCQGDNIEWGRKYYKFENVLVNARLLQIGTLNSFRRGDAYMRH